MGRLNYEPVMQHFSHPHPLELVQLTNTNQLAPSSPCAGCKLKASGWIYTCRACSYALHISCAQMAPMIQHSFHPHHPLTLLPLPAYPQGFFNCDACGRRGEGFSYHCSSCDVDVHPLCASMPLSVSHQAHPHPLALTFFPPYENKGFSCDICSNLGSNHWLYRCSACEFDAHMSCAMAKPKPRLQVQNQQPQMAMQGSNPQFQAAGIGLQNRPQQGYVQNYYVNNQGQGFPPGGQGQPGVGNGQGNSFADPAIEGFIDSTVQQAGQSFIQMIAGGGGGGGGDDSSNSGSFLSQLFSGGSGSSGDN